MDTPAVQTEIIGQVLKIKDLEQLAEIKKVIDGFAPCKVNIVQSPDDTSARPDIEPIRSKVMEIKSNMAAMKKLKRKNKKSVIEVYEMIMNAIQDWEPAPNEIAIGLDIINDLAWKVWFIEKYPDGRLRFKEGPPEFYPLTYFSISITEKIEVPDFIIMPMPFFNILQKQLPFLQITPREYDRLVR